MQRAYRRGEWSIGEDVGEEDDLKTRAVFVDNAKEGELARDLREVVERLKTILR